MSIVTADEIYLAIYNFYRLILRGGSTLNSVHNYFDHLRFRFLTFQARLVARVRELQSTRPPAFIGLYLASLTGSEL